MAMSPVTRIAAGLNSTVLNFIPLPVCEVIQPVMFCFETGAALTEGQPRKASCQSPRYEFRSLLSTYRQYARSRSQTAFSSAISPDGDARACKEAGPPPTRSARMSTTNALGLLIILSLRFTAAGILCCRIVAPEGARACGV